MGNEDTSSILVRNAHQERGGIQRLEFAVRLGTWKTEECRNKDDSGVCLARWWLEEPTELGKGLPWFEVSEFDGMWFAKASPNLCAFCEKFTRRIDEASENRKIALLYVVTLLGSSRKKECIHQIEGRCEELECFRLMCSDSGEFDEDYFREISISYCACCWRDTSGAT